MKPNEQAARIDQAVSYWVDSAYYMAMTERVRKVLGYPPGPQLSAMRNAPFFQGALLRSVSEPFDRARFCDPFNESIHQLGTWALVPQFVHAWSRNSRRIYHLSRDLQALLSVTSLRRVTWGSIGWPFDAFAITLARPISNGRGGQCDCILVHRQPNRETGRLAVEILLLPTDLANQRFLTRDDRAQRERWFKKQRFEKIGIELFTAPDIRRCTQPPFVRYNIEDPNNERIVKSFSPRTRVNHITNFDEIVQIRGNETGYMESTLRLVIGLCLFTTLRPAGVSPVREWQDLPAIPGGTPNVVTRGSQTCVVQSAFILTPEEVKIYEEAASSPHAAIERSPHFRCGFWRRPWGQGHDPLARKTVWIHPTIVRRDRLRRGQIPRGYQAMVRRTETNQGRTP